jgi:Tol biopolymer transport system component
VPLPPTPETLPSAREVPPAATAKKKPFPIGLAAGIGMVVIVIIAGFVFLPGILDRTGSETPAASLPTNTKSQPTSDDIDQQETEDQGAALPTHTSPATDTPEPDPISTNTPQPTNIPAATPIGGGGMIAFSSNRSGEPQIFLLDLISGEISQMTDISGGACQPEWSNDGQRLVFIAPCKQNQQSYPGSSLFIINADGTQMNPLPSSPIGDYDPSWSPVDNRVVFTTIRDFDRPQIWVLDVDSGQSVNLSNNSQSDYQPIWSSDGSKILFSSNRVVGRAKLWIMDTQGQNVGEFSLSDNRTNIEAVWSSENDLVIFTQFDGQGRGIPILIGTNWREGGPQAGMVEFRISDNPTGMREADISPDGLWIVFSSNTDPSNLDIYMMRVNGAEMTPLVVNESNDFDPAWRP